MGVYADSSPDAFDDPKVETIVEILTRIWGSAIGVVSTAFLVDATPIALTGHSRSRYTYDALLDQALNGVTNFTWTKFDGPDVFFGAGADNFITGFKGKNYFDAFAEKGYSVSLNKTSLETADNSTKALGVFSTSNLPVWLDRNVYTENIAKSKNHPSGNGSPATDLPGLKEMTLKAIDVLHKRGGDKGFFLMSEAASIDKQMHTLDYDRALGDLLELDDTVKATIEKLTALGVLNDTLILVTADHGHGFDVFGSADTEYLAKGGDDRAKRDAIGTYALSGLSQYQVANASISYNTGANFPTNWSPRYALAQGVVAHPDAREDYKVHGSPRLPATPINKNDYYVNNEDATDGFLVNGTLPVSDAQGVHSLTDVPVFAMGPCQEKFGGVYNNIDIFFEMANCLGLARSNGNVPSLNATKTGSASGATFTGGATRMTVNNGGLLAALGAMGAAFVGAATLL
jgi:alkaline phosphatase